MKHDNDEPWREKHLTPEQWDQVALEKWLRRSQETPKEINGRQQAAHEMGLVAQAFMLSALTLRQRQVVELYCLDGLTQVEVADALGISQATVSQHLKGKFRNGHYVGGAFRKIRKTIHKAAKVRAGKSIRHIQIMEVFDELLDSSITRRRASEILRELSRSVKPSEE